MDKVDILDKMDKVDFLDKHIGRMKKRHRFTAETQKANALDEALFLHIFLLPKM